MNINQSPEDKLDSLAENEYDSDYEILSKPYIPKLLDAPKMKIVYKDIDMKKLFLQADQTDSPKKTHDNSYKNFHKKSTADFSYEPSDEKED